MHRHPIVDTGFSMADQFKCRALLISSYLVVSPRVLASRATRLRWSASVMTKRMNHPFTLFTRGTEDTEETNFSPGGRRRPAKRPRPLRGRMMKVMPALNLYINRNISPQGCKLLLDRRLPIQQKNSTSVPSVSQW